MAARGLSRIALQPRSQHGVGVGVGCRSAARGQHLRSELSPHGVKSLLTLLNRHIQCNYICRDLRKYAPSKCKKKRAYKRFMEAVL